MPNADAQKVQKPTDHITCHPDGTFHIRTKDEDLYVHRMKRVEPLAADTPIFLEFIILSDRARNYAVRSAAAKTPSVVVRIRPDDVLQVRGVFSGARFDLESVMAATIATLRQRQAFAQPVIKLDGSTLKGLLYYEAVSPPEEVFAQRPRGTILSFKFPVGPDVYLVKAFLIT